MDNNKLFFRTYIPAIIIASAVVCLFALLSSCKVKEKLVVDTSALTIQSLKDSLSASKKREERLGFELSESRKQTDLMAEFAAGNDSLLSDVINKLQDDKELSDSDRDTLAARLRRAMADCKPTGSATIKPDGSIKLEGLLKLNTKILEEQSKAFYWQEKHSSEFLAHNITKDTLSKRTERFESSKTVKPAFPWWIYFAGVGSGVFLWILVGGKIKKFIEWVRK